MTWHPVTLPPPKEDKYLCACQGDGVKFYDVFYWSPDNPGNGFLNDHYRQREQCEATAQTITHWTEIANRP